MAYKYEETDRYNMHTQKLKLETLISDMFECGMIVDSKRNKMLVSLILFCVTFLANFIKQEDVTI